MENIIERPKICFSAVQPTGALTIGNYIGAVKNFVALQNQFECIYAVADMHSITIDMVPANFRKNVFDLFAMFLAFGLDPNKSTVFVQSHVPAHAELAWILNCSTQFGEASRMTQFKDKSRKHSDNINVGLFAYPVLMAADILLYHTDVVPIGEDQKQHLELARTIAERFNSKYSPTFTVPEAFFPKHGAKVYSLADPKVKMSKSDDNENAFVLVTDTPDTIVRKLKRAVTDSDTVVKFSKDKPGISNLMTIYSSFTGLTMPAIELEFDGKSYADFKSKVADSIIAGLAPIQAEYSRIASDKAYVLAMMKQGKEKAERQAERVLSKVKRKVGFVELG